MDSEDAESSYTCERRKSDRHVHYADSFDSDASEMDKYLDEAFEVTEDDDDNDYRNQEVSFSSFI